MTSLRLHNARHRLKLITWISWLALSFLLLWGCSILVFFLYGMNESITLNKFYNHEKSWDSKILHVVLTRFMQDQPNLVHLARARLFLFQKVCLPSMIQQSTSQFLWIILTDPDLDLEIRKALCEIIKPYPNFILLGTNRQIQGETFRSSLGKHFLQVPLFSGSILKLRQAYSIRDSIPILQTRLDADDALHKEFLEFLQLEAFKLFNLETNDRHNLRSLVDNNHDVQWYFWCVQRHFEWYANSNIWNPVEHSRLCVTPGLTVGMAPKSSYFKSSPPLDLAHDILFKTLLATTPDCGVSPCIRMIHELPFGAVRTRTWTSAGMMNILTLNQTSIIDPVSQEKIQKLCRLYFGIESLLPVKTYLQTHLIQIAKDNLKGQCTPGHSCKEKSALTLQKMIAKMEEETVQSTNV
jgi:hypothetical protein